MVWSLLCTYTIYDVLCAIYKYGPALVDDITGSIMMAFVTTSLGDGDGCTVIGWLVGVVVGPRDGCTVIGWIVGTFVGGWVGNGVGLSDKHRTFTRYCPVICPATIN
eukprot:1002495_1